MTFDEPSPTPRHLTRRRLMHGTLLGGLAVAVAGGTGTAWAAPRSSDWAALAASISGQVILPAQRTAFTQAKQIFNTRYDGSSPVAVVAPKTVADVQRCMAFAVKHRLRVATRSGGHSYTGASAASGLVVVDLRRLDGGIGYDSGSGLATVTPASTLYAVAGGLAQQGRSVPVGTCATVGVAGLTLGGGLGSTRGYTGSPVTPSRPRPWCCRTAKSSPLRQENGTISTGRCAAEVVGTSGSSRR